MTRRLLEKRMRKTTVFTAFCKNRSNLIDLIQKSNSVHHYFSTSVVQMIKKNTYCKLEYVFNSSFFDEYLESSYVEGKYDI